MQELKIYKTKDLVLDVTEYYNPEKLNLGEWDRFLDVLCGSRTYQKEAIRKAIIYFASGEYNNIEDLVRKNHYNNPEIRKRYPELNDYYKKIQLPNKFSGTIDLATGTGKSYVIYGIAQIMLGLGLVDNVLVLCPSLTIEKGLTKKFVELTSNSKLKEAIPDSSKAKNPRIVDASTTVKKEDICVENIHAVYERTGSSITDSFGFSKGAKTLVLNDESHHIYNKNTGRDLQSKRIKVWKSFLLDSAYSFKYTLGFTGTAYIGNDYFNDVIYRYSLRQAIEEGFIKSIDYVAKDDSSQEYQKFQKIHQNHQRNKDFYNEIRPLTILVTNNIQNAKRLETRLVEFLSEFEGISENEIRENKVLTVTSHSDHEHNLIRLENVDDKEETIEWIISVSMLTEGWDVKNVFQIVPMEERAFNSKLLIAQVLGRGLRIPQSYPKSTVTIFNHDSWSNKIKGLVDEILEIELKLYSEVLTENQDRAKYHFQLYNIDYTKKEKIIENTSQEKQFNYKDFIQLESAVEKVNKETTYQNIAGESREQDYDIRYRMTSVKDVVNKIYHEFKTREWEGVTLGLSEENYTKNNLPPKSKIEELVRNSLKRVGIEGDMINEKNKKSIFGAFNTLLRKKNKTVVLTRIVEKPILVETKKREREGLSVGNLRHGATVFYTDNYNEEIVIEDNLKVLEEVVDPDGDLPKSADRKVNSYQFKTPINIVFTSKEPERKFVDKLTKADNSKHITSWIKSTNQSFYSIEYSVTTESGNHTKQARFNPDFFIKIEKDGIENIIVVEIKSDGDYSIENRAKNKWAKIHFSDLNKELQKQKIAQKYFFHFLSPENYDEFFEYLKDGRLIENKFISNLDNELSK